MKCVIHAICYSGIYQYAVDVSSRNVFKRNVNSSVELGEAFFEVTLYNKHKIIDIMH